MLATLNGYRDAIVAEVDGVALRVGRLLREARDVDPDFFPRWVDVELPFGYETARRLMAISAAYEKLPTELLRDLPRPWQALYALKELPSEKLVAAVKAGKLSAATTVAQSKAFARQARGGQEFYLYKRANLTAGRLLRCSPKDVKPKVREALQEWLDRA